MSEEPKPKPPIAPYCCGMTHRQLVLVQLLEIIAYAIFMIWLFPMLSPAGVAPGSLEWSWFAYYFVFLAIMCAWILASARIRTEGRIGSAFGTLHAIVSWVGAARFVHFSLAPLLFFTVSSAVLIVWMLRTRRL